MTPATERPNTPAPEPSHPAPARPRLIATDLDGTLLQNDKTVSDRTVAALAAAERAGIEVFFVTGRPARWMDVVSAHVHGHGLAICANGAAVVDLHRGGLPIEVRPLAADQALAVVEALREAASGTSFAVERSGGIFYEAEYPPFHLDPGAIVAPAEKLLHDGFAHADMPVLKLLAHHRVGGERRDRDDTPREAAGSAASAGAAEAGQRGAGAATTAAATAAAPHAWMCTEVTPAGGVKVPSAVNSWTPWMMDGGRGGLGRPPPRVSSA
ncbi:HMP-PP phosphatase [Streptomyces antimycoticus]